jgi:hypothetical protein
MDIHIINGADGIFSVLDTFLTEQEKQLPLRGFKAKKGSPNTKKQRELIETFCHQQKTST